MRGSHPPVDFEFYVIVRPVLLVLWARLALKKLSRPAMHTRAIAFGLWGLRSVSVPRAMVRGAKIIVI